MVEFILPGGEPYPCGPLAVHCSCSCSFERYCTVGTEKKASLPISQLHEGDKLLDRVKYCVSPN